MKGSDRMDCKKIPKAVIERIPLYLNCLDKLNSDNTENTSSKQIADEIGLGEVQVRKDLNLISGNGKPKIGYKVVDLQSDLQKTIRNSEKTNFIIVGCGKIGEALANYKGFSKHDFALLGLFDNNISKIGKKILELEILSEEKLSEFCNHNHIDIGIIAVPCESAQKVCDDLVASGVKGILNFTNAKLNVKENISIRNVDIVSLLTMIAIEINE